MIGQGEKDRKQYDEKKEIPYAYGAATMFPKSLLEKSGNIPEVYFLYYEEIEWSINIRNAGFKILFIPESMCFMVHQRLLERKVQHRVYYYFRNRGLFMKRNAPLVNKGLFFLYYFGFVIPAKLLTFLFKAQFSLSKALLEATIWLLKKNGKAKGPYPERIE